MHKANESLAFSPPSFKLLARNSSFQFVQLFRNLFAKPLKVNSPTFPLKARKLDDTKMYRRPCPSRSSKYYLSMKIANVVRCLPDVVLFPFSITRALDKTVFNLQVWFFLDANFVHAARQIWSIPGQFHNKDKPVVSR